MDYSVFLVILPDISWLTTRRFHFSIISMTEKLTEQQKTGVNPELCSRIFSASAGMVGVCLTLIGLIRVTISIRKADTMADDLLALNALVFLASCLISYWALRAQTRRRMEALERAADLIFMSALAFLVGIGLFVVYAISVH